VLGLFTRFHKRRERDQESQDAGNPTQTRKRGKKKIPGKIEETLIPIPVNTILRD
jgi:hypothetical protein